MRDREGGHRPDELPPVPDQQDQREDEHQMVDPAQDVIDPECEIGRDHPEPSLRRRHAEAGARRRQPLALRPARHQFVAHQYVRLGQLQPLDGDLAAFEPPRTAGDPGRHEGGAVEFERSGLPRVAGLRQDRGDLHRSARARRHLPIDLPGVPAERPQVEKARLQRVRHRRPRPEARQQCREKRQGRHESGSPGLPDAGTGAGSGPLPPSAARIPDGREPGRTGRKGPCSPRSAQVRSPRRRRSLVSQITPDHKTRKTKGNVLGR